MKALETLICLATKILKIGPKLRAYGLDTHNISKSWCLNISEFQELSFDVQNTHVARGHVPKNVS